MSTRVTLRRKAASLVQLAVLLLFVTLAVGAALVSTLLAAIVATGIGKS